MSQIIILDAGVTNTCIYGMNAVDCFQGYQLLSILTVVLSCIDLFLPLSHDLMPQPFRFLEGHHSYRWSINKILLPLAQKWLLLALNIELCL